MRASWCDTIIPIRPLCKVNFSIGANDNDLDIRDDAYAKQPASARPVSIIIFRFKNIHLYVINASFRFSLPAMPTNGNSSAQWIAQSAKPVDVQFYQSYLHSRLAYSKQVSDAFGMVLASHGAKPSSDCKRTKGICLGHGRCVSLCQRLMRQQAASGVVFAFVSTSIGAALNAHARRTFILLRWIGDIQQIGWLL